ncbi:tannase/feruloyl esterase family alpha/beta hydrolase [Sphingobium boeckii]|uniref:Feruloyl esterase n=1 Tax=Sphingobium boeckii TaxID=1082345 RepID=A0A7W9EDE8_9SPHN|nr:tannase/feruloyl esterase family alpha/beta hydrolase [Sphingobium boeckii]MBB5685037.1 feruloyl esterase [Sphingobium boeckii]
MMMSATGEVRAAAGQAAAPAISDGCSTLTGFQAEGVTIVTAQTQPAQDPVAGVKIFDLTGQAPDGMPVAGLPSFCRIVGRIMPEQGSNIGFEVWMPTTRWDGRLHGVGVGGFAGYVDHMMLALAVKGGQVGVATDTGHDSTASGWPSADSSWARGHPQRVRDYGWRAVHLSTIAAKQLIRAFYGRDADRSYFVGCSGGGRQGLIEASRFPDDYDGIVAGAPAASLTDLAIVMSLSIQSQKAPGAAIRPEQGQLVQDEVIRQCDAGDGQVDGLVADPRQCRFDVSKLACGTSKSDQCFSPPQITALKKIYAGPRDAAGRQLTAAYLPAGSEVSTPFPFLGWDAYIWEGSPQKPTSNALAGGFLGDFIDKPFATPETFDFDTDPARLKAALSNDLDASPDLSRFFARGGKLITWHGWADAAIPPEGTLWYHEAMLRQSGEKAKDSSRLFMVPGVQHCVGGNGPWSFGQLNAPQEGDSRANSMVAALQDWVEKDVRPDSLIGRSDPGGALGFPAQKPEGQRLLCAWPRKAVLRAGGDPRNPASYSCTGSHAASTEMPRD